MFAPIRGTGVPLVSCPERFEDGMLDADTVKALVHVPNGTKEHRFFGAGPDPEEADLRMEGRRVAAVHLC
jgi:hypothetical protein